MNEILFEKYRENKLDLEKLESITYCWNNPSWSRITNKTTNEYNQFSYCCPEFPLHSLFIRKDFSERTLTSKPLMPVRSTEYYRRLEEVSNKPTLIKQNGSSSQWCSRCPKITPRRSVLKSHATLVNSAILSASHLHLAKPLINTTTMNTIGSNSQEQQRMALRHAKALDSDGDSPRSASPLSSEVDEEDFLMSRKHERLSDYISEGAASASRESENEGVGQQVGRRPYTRQRKQNQRQSLESDINKEKDPLQEHSYYQSRRESVNLKRLRRETFSETGKSHLFFFFYYSNLRVCNI